MADIMKYEDLGLSRVINARGTVTHLGSSILSDTVLNCMTRAGKNFVMLDRLKDRASEVIAEATGAEAGCVTSGAAAGMIIATTACMTGSVLAKIKQIPDTSGMRDEVVVQLGHMVDYMSLLRLPGAKVVPVGCVNSTSREDLAAAITDKTAAIFYIISHWCVSQGMLSLQDVVEIASNSESDIPVVVDAAAELNLNYSIDEGADLVIYSGGKAVAGPSGTGFICGSGNLIEACRLQYNNIARPMKVDKEETIALMYALKEYIQKDHDAVHKQWVSKVRYLVDELKNISRFEPAIVYNKAYAVDPRGNPLPTFELSWNPREIDIHPSDVVLTLMCENPSIHVQDYWSDKIGVDVTRLQDGEEKIVARELRRVLTGERELIKDKPPYRGYQRT